MSSSVELCLSRRPVPIRVVRTPLMPLSQSSKDRTYVDHTYHDHLHDPERKGVDDAETKRVMAVCKKAPRGGVTIAFPEKLHMMLRICEAEGLDHIVSWLPHGRGFLVRQKEKFVELIMPRFFNQSKMTSFQRQLNLYSFNRLTSGVDRGSYYHARFLRGRSDLVSSMARTRVKGNGMKATSSPQTEPDFYAMEPCFEPSEDIDPSYPENINSLSVSSTISQDVNQYPIRIDDMREALPPFVELFQSQELPSIMHSTSFESLAPLSAVVSLPSTPQTDTNTLHLEKEEEWPQLHPSCINFSHVSSTVELYHQWKNEDSSLFLGADRDEFGIGIEI